MSLELLRSFLGKNVSDLLETEPFKHWPYQLVPADPVYAPDEGYIFTDNGLELRCVVAGVIKAALVHSSKFGGYSELEPVFGFTRNEVLNSFGEPYQTGNRFWNPILGKVGAHDLFKFQDHAIHFTYGYDRDHVEMITLMTIDALPV